MYLHHTPWHHFSDAHHTPVEFDFNMWSKRLQPYEDFPSESQYISVTGGGPRKGRLMNEMVIADAVVAEYHSKAHAWDIIEASIDPANLKMLQWDRNHFLTNGYTAAAPKSGYLIAWVGVPSVNFNQPRPADLRFLGNGWAWMPDADLAHRYHTARPVGPDDFETFTAA